MADTADSERIETCADCEGDGSFDGSIVGWNYGGTSSVTVPRRYVCARCDGSGRVLISDDGEQPWGGDNGTMR